MSKVYFFNIPFHGHVNLSLALAEELVKRGEEVIYYCTDSFKEKIQSTGATYRSYGKSFYMDENFVTFNITDICKVHIHLSELILDKILNDIKNEKPDYIVHDTLCTWAKYAAQISNTPAVNVVSTLVFVGEDMPLPIKIKFMKYQIETYVKNIPNMVSIFKISRRLRKKYGIRVKDFVTDIIDNKEKLNIVFTSKEFQPDFEKVGSEYSFIGPVSVYRNENCPDFVLDKPEGKRLLYISMGTLFNNNVEFFNQCFEAFKDMDLNVLMSVGKDIDIPSLKVPKNFTVMRYIDIPQLEVLKKCDVFITHGGMNSVHEGLYYGVPLIAIPQQSEEAMVGGAIEKSGSGIRLNTFAITQELLKESVEKIISDQSFRDNALRMRDSFINAGGAKRAIDIILSYKEKRNE